MLKQGEYYTLPSRSLVLCYHYRSSPYNYSPYNSIRVTTPRIHTRHHRIVATRIRRESVTQRQTRGCGATPKPTHEAAVHIQPGTINRRCCNSACMHITRRGGIRRTRRRRKTESGAYDKITCFLPVLGVQHTPMIIFRIITVSIRFIAPIPSPIIRGLVFVAFDE